MRIEALMVAEGRNLVEIRKECIVVEGWRSGREWRHPLYAVVRKRWRAREIYIPAFAVK